MFALSAQVYCRESLFSNTQLRGPHESANFSKTQLGGMRTQTISMPTEEFLRQVKEDGLGAPWADRCAPQATYSIINYRNELKLPNRQGFPKEKKGHANQSLSEIDSTILLKE